MGKTINRKKMKKCFLSTLQKFTEKITLFEFLQDIPVSVFDKFWTHKNCLKKQTNNIFADQNII